ncbi:MAG: hypothetical protein ACK5LL_09280 [Suipraeoptans sp.]
MTYTLYCVTTGFAEEIIQSFEEYRDFGRFYYSKMLAEFSKPRIHGVDPKTEKVMIFDTENDAIEWCKE